MYKRREKELLAGLIEAAIEEMEEEVIELRRMKDFMMEYADAALIADYRAMVAAEEAAQN